MPRIDWRGVTATIHHKCIFPQEEMFYHGDGLSHIGIDNLISTPSNHALEYNGALEPSANQLTSIEAQENNILKNNEYKTCKTLLLEARYVIQDSLNRLSATNRAHFLQKLRYINSYVYHFIRQNSHYSITSRLPCSLISGANNNLKPYMDISSVELVLKRFSLLILSSR